MFLRICFSPSSIDRYVGCRSPYACVLGEVTLDFLYAVRSLAAALRTAGNLGKMNPSVWIVLLLLGISQSYAKGTFSFSSYGKTKWHRPTSYLTTKRTVKRRNNLTSLVSIVALSYQVSEYIFVRYLKFFSIDISVTFATNYIHLTI